MDKIIIKNLEIYANHGVFKEETFLGQKFILSLELSLDTRCAGNSDNLLKSVHYGEVCHFIEEFFTKQNFKLIETCAEKTVEALFIKFPLVQQIHILIKKPWAPIGSHVEYAGVEITRKRHRVFLGIGGNLGDKKENISNAVLALKTSITTIVKESSLYITKPWGKLDQDDFLNCVVEIQTLLTPFELLKFIQSIELNLKRERTIHWGARTIDIDILLYDDCITDSEDLVIPHPQMQNRLFVLTPFTEIAPFVIHPILNQRIITLNELAEKLEPENMYPIKQALIEEDNDE